jgi:hypothetical protein
MPYCTECGSQVKESDKFCGNCGNTLKQSVNSVPRIPVTDSSFRNSSDMNSYSGVLSWVLKTHVEAITSLTSEIAPFLETAVRIDEEKEEYYFPTSIPNEYYAANVDNLLFRTEFIGFPYEYLIALDRVKKNVKISVDKMRKIKEKTIDLMKEYASTKEALEAIVKISTPIEKIQFDFAMLRKNENVTNLNRLMKYEKGVTDYEEEIRKQDWSRFPQVDPSIWKEKVTDHAINTINMELEMQLFQYPVLSLFPLNIHTDVERRLIPFFVALDRIDDSYYKCKSLFEKCKSSSGFLKKPPPELKEEAVAALQEFNINYGGLCFPAEYASGILKIIEKDNEHGIRRIRPHKYSLNDVDKLITNPSSDGSVKNAEEIIKQIYYRVSRG